MTNIVTAANNTAVSVFQTLTTLANTGTNTVSSASKLIDGLMTNATVYHAKQMATVQPRIGLAVTAELTNVALTHSEKMTNLHKRASANTETKEIFEKTLQSIMKSIETK